MFSSSVKRLLSLSILTAHDTLNVPCTRRLGSVTVGCWIRDHAVVVSTPKRLREMLSTTSYAVLTPLFEENPLTLGHKILSRNRVFVAANSKSFVILVCTDLIGVQSVADAHTDRRTDVSAIAKTKHYMVSSVNIVFANV